MFRSVLIFCSATILLRGVSSHLFSKHFLELKKSTHHLKDFKRQGDEDCIVIKLFGGPPECLFMAASFADDAISFEDLPSVICDDTCGKLFLDIFGECGRMNGTQIQLLADLCYRNQNGDLCYNALNNFIQAIENLPDTVCPFIDTCSSTCQSAVSQGVSDAGCCFNVFLDFLTDEDPTLTAYMMEQLRSCNVNVPPGCNNSPMGSSSTIFHVTHLAIPSTLLFIAMLG